MLRHTLAVVTSFVAITLGADDPKALALRAVQGDGAARRALRAMGQPGVDALLKVRSAVDAKAFDAAIDAVCRQRDCAWSGLHWYTDLAAAKQEARRTHRPILSLRLLGNLDEELSCANSRYFRTLLYPNEDIRAYLRSQYVLHWQSERASPVITIDFGDGRKMRRTITGNSIHYVLDAEGRPIDAIPGLYQPPRFLTLLREGVALHRALAAPDPHRTREERLRMYHANAIYSTRKDSPQPSLFAAANDYGRAREQRVASWLAATAAPTKGGGEMPVLANVSFDARALGAATELAQQLKSMIAGTRTIDANARALIQAKRASAPEAMRTKASFEAMLVNLEKTLAIETRINEQEHHRAIHGWFGKGEVADLEALNRRVYAELFLAPRSDPWMGLVARESFTGIVGEGLQVAR